MFESDPNGFAMVYQVTNRENGKVYVGQTTMDLAARWCCHVSAAKKVAKTPLARAIRKYGPEAFDVKPLVLVDASALDEAEREWIAKLGSLSPDGYNLTVGGQASGGKQAPEVCERKRQAHLARYRDPWQRKRQSWNSWVMWQRPEVKAKASESQKAAWTPEKREKARQRCIGIDTRTPEGKARSTEARKSRVVVTSQDGTQRAFESHVAASEALGLDQSAVSMCVNGQRRSHKGYTFAKE